MNLKKSLFLVMAVVCSSNTIWSMQGDGAMIYKVDDMQYREDLHKQSLIESLQQKMSEVDFQWSDVERCLNHPQEWLRAGFMYKHQKKGRGTIQYVISQLSPEKRNRYEISRWILTQWRSLQTTQRVNAAKLQNNNSPGFHSQTAINPDELYELLGGDESGIGCGGRKKKKNNGGDRKRGRNNKPDQDRD